MPLNNQDMADAIQNNLDTGTDANDILTSFGVALSTYINDNSTAFDVNITMTPSGGYNKQDSLDDMAGQITTGVRLGQYINPSPPPTNLSLSGISLLTLSMAVTSDADVAFLELTTQIVSWLQGYGVV